jgi:hypothetical protein
MRRPTEGLDAAVRHHKPAQVPTAESASRTAFAHDALLVLDPHGDERAPGGAVTRALCGSWSHEPPCPLAPHHTRADRAGAEIVLRILFAATPADEERVRRLIHEALDTGWGDDPGGVRTTWHLVRSEASPLRDDELAHAQRLTRN